MTGPDESKTLTFRCPTGLQDILPPPLPAALGLPDWLKAMPSQAYNVVNAITGDTIKRCPPFVDAMTSGFLIPLICDLRVENGEFTWDNELPPGGEVNYVRSPIGLHDASQVTGTPLFEPGRYVIKFHNLWTIEAPDGYALLFTHPVNRFDLPFTTLSGLVDSDRYHDNWTHFSAHWHDLDFKGVLPKGTPAFRSSAKAGWRARRSSRARKRSARTISQAPSIARPASTVGNFAPSATTPGQEISRLRRASER